MNRPGLRNSPSIRYVSSTPPFGYDDDGAPIGGLFRDGRAQTLATQAAEPFLDADEMANATPAEVIGRLASSPNVARFRAVYGEDALERPATAFLQIAAAIAQYEMEHPDFRRFDSKYDAWLAGKSVLAAQEMRGLMLFEDPEKGNCAACHPSRPSAGGEPPLFTDFTYDNVGVPRNTRLPTTGPGAFDLGLCGPKRQDLAARRERCGAFKVPTLRNVSRTAPYFHNGRMGSLREVVDFYVTRDTRPGGWYPTQAGELRKFDDLPAGLEDNVNTSEAPYDRAAGDAPALTPAEIDDVVAFLKTLDDGYN